MPAPSLTAQTRGCLCRPLPWRHGSGGSAPNSPRKRRPASSSPLNLAALPDENSGAEGLGEYGSMMPNGGGYSSSKGSWGQGGGGGMPSQGSADGLAAGECLYVATYKTFYHHNFISQLLHILSSQFIE